MSQLGYDQMQFYLSVQNLKIQLAIFKLYKSKKKQQ